MSHTQDCGQQILVAPDASPSADTSLLVAKIDAAIRASTAGWGELFRPDAFRGLALVVATSAPGLADPDLATLGKLGAWICAFDDLVDDGAITEQELSLRIAQYGRLICGECAELAFDPLARVLEEVLDALWVAPLGKSLWPLLTSQLLASCEAMQWERVAVATKGCRPAHVDVYLQHGADSICVGIAATAAAMLIGEAEVLSLIPTLLAAQRHSATAVRIANDLATWSREQHESSAANALACVGASVEMLLTRIDVELRALSCTLNRLRIAVPKTATFLDRFTSCFVTLYRRGDLTDLRELAA